MRSEGGGCHVIVASRLRWRAERARQPPGTAVRGPAPGVTVPLVEAGTGGSSSRATRTVALEVSALHGGSHAAIEFVAFALAALREADDLAPVEWSVRAVPRAARDGARLHHAVRARLAARLAVLGLPITTRWATARSEIVFQASGPLALRAAAPGVVTVLRLAPDDRDVLRRRRLDRLRRAASDGVILHAPTHAAAAALAGAVGIEPSSIAVAVPGVRVTRRVAQPTSLGGAVLVVEGESPSRDHAVLDALRAAGAPAVLARSAGSSNEATCCVVATPDDAFPLTALEAIAAGTAVVVARSPATTELLEGAATLVDGSATQDFVEVAMELHANEAARAIAVAACRARAEDFTWARRSHDLREIVRRSLSRRDTRTES